MSDNKKKRTFEEMVYDTINEHAQTLDEQGERVFKIEQDLKRVWTQFKEILEPIEEDESEEEEEEKEEKIEEDDPIYGEMWVCPVCKLTLVKGAYTGDRYCTRCAFIDPNTKFKLVCRSIKEFEQFDIDKRAKDVCEHGIWLGEMPHCEKCTPPKELPIRPKSP
jgi:rubrerythrin